METSNSTHATTYRLNLQKGISNIGSHPANDIVIDDPRVQPFHLILDHRKKPYQIIPLSPESNIRLNGIAIAGNDPIEVKDLNQVQFNGFAFHTNSGPAGAETGEIEITPPRFQTEASSAYEVLPVLPEEQLPGPSAPANLTGLEKSAQPRQFPPALKDDIILVTLIEVNHQVDVETPAVYRLSVINAGPIVASFDVRVEGLPQEWVRISPRKLNLNESGRAETEIQICAPRDPSSTAASYPIQFSISSPNYPDHVGQADSTYVLNPYYEYTLGNLDPKQRSASYNKRVGTVAFPISNMGNSPEIYQVSATDDENGLLFEFPQPDQTRLARQAEVKVGAGETKTVPMVINPIRRHIFRMRGRQYHYNVHARQAEQESGQLVSGSFTSQPLLGFFSALLIVAIAAVAVFFLMRPRIIEFYAVKDIVEKGQAVTLRWKVSFFTRDLIIEGIPDPVKGTQSQVSTMPTSVASTYTLVASNWLSRTLRMPDLRSAPVTVLTIPAPPAITTFSVDKNEAFVGDTVKAKWSIGNADQAYLTVDGITTILAAENFNGELPITLARDTLVVLEAKNNAGSLVRSEFLRARQPSILIEEFSLSKTTITLGDPVTIKWKVSGIGAESVMIAPFEEPLPLTGELTFYPKESMEFVMSVENRDLKEIRLLPVGVLPPGAPPEPPAISFFKAAPEERVGEGTVEFSWSVSGTTDKIEITNSAGLVAGALPAQGFKSTLVKQTTNFIMTAYNKTVSSSAIVEVKIKPDLMPTQVLIHSTIPNSSIMRGETMQVYFTVKPMVNGLPVDDVIAAKLPEVSGKVVVTDGFDTCEAELPKTSCVITLNTSSPTKKLTATYYGDAIYARRTSPPYPETGVILVMGTPTRFVQNTIDNKTIDGKPIFSQNDVVTGELATLTFYLAPKDPSKVDPVSGEVQVLDITDDQVNGVLLCRVNLGGVVGFPNEGTAFCTFSFPTAGTKNLRVRYMGNAVYDGVIYPSPTDSSLSLEVNEGETVTKITSNLSAESLTGQPVPVSVLVQAKVPASGTPTGLVRIYDVNNSAVSCHATLTNGIGSCEIVFTEAGDNRQVLANYVGDLNFLESDSLIVNHTVKQAATKTVFTSFPAPTYVGQTISFDFKSEVLPPGSGILSGEAVVMDGINEVCRIAHVNNGVGTCSTTILNSTAKAYRVIYDPADAATPDPNFATSDSLVTTYTPLLSGTKFESFSASAFEGAYSLLEPAKATYTVHVVAVPDSPVSPAGTVRVLASTGEFCEFTVPVTQSCELIFNNTGGLRTVRAYFFANANYTASQSDPLQFNVKKYSTVTVVSADTPPYYIDQPVVFTLTVTPLDPGVEIPTGTGTVTAGSQNCTVTLGKKWDDTAAPNPNEGSCRLTFTKAIDYDYSAQYGGDSLFVASTTSAAQSLTVERARTKVEITNVSTLSPQYGQTFTVNFSVTKQVSDPNTYSPAPTGNVKVSASPTETCTGSVVNGTGSCQLKLTTLGARTLTPDYTETVGALRFYDDDTNSTNVPFNGVVVAKANTEIEVHVTRKGGTPPTDITTALINEPIRVSFTVSAPSSSEKPTSVEVTVSADSPGEQCIPSPTSDADGNGWCELKLTKTGSRNITVTYPSTTYFNSSSATIPNPVVVSKASVTLSATPDITTVHVGEEVTYDVTISPVPPSESAPSNLVTLSAIDSLSTLVTGTCTGGIVGTISSEASCTISYPNPGTWTLTLKYSDVANIQYETTTITPAPTVTVIKDSTTTTNNVTTATPTVESPVQFVVTVVAGNSTKVLPSLPVTLGFDLVRPSGSATLPAITCGSYTTGYYLVDPNKNKAYLSAVCSFTPDDKGNWKLTSTYPGDTNFEPDASGQDTINVAALASPSMTLNRTAPSGTDYYVGQTYTFTASISYTKSDPTGSVTFTATGNTLDGCLNPVPWIKPGSDKTVIATCTTILSNAGTTTITASYAGDSKYDAISQSLPSFTVNLIPTTLSTTTNPLSPSKSANRGEIISPSFIFNVTAPATGSTVTGGQVTIAPADLFVSPLPCPVSGGVCTATATISSTATSGSHTVTANYVGVTPFASSTSITLGTLTVRYPTTLTANPNPFPVSVNQGGSLSLPFSITAGTTVGAGTVTIESNPSGLFTSTPTCTVVNGACTATLNIKADAAPAAYTITATYGQTETYMSSTSGTLGTLTVRYPTTLTADPNPFTASVIPGGSLSLPLSVTAIGTTVNAGIVSVSSNPAGLFSSTPTCSIGASGTCTAMLNILSGATLGGYTITANYGETSTYASSTTMGTLMVRTPATFLGIYNYSDQFWGFFNDYLAVEVKADAVPAFDPARDTVLVEFTDSAITTPSHTLTYRGLHGTGVTAYHTFAVSIDNPLHTNYDSITIALVSSTDNPKVQPFDPVTLNNHRIADKDILDLP